MKQSGLLVLLCALMVHSFSLYASGQWKRMDTAKLSLNPSLPRNAVVFLLQDDGMKDRLAGMRTGAASGETMELPLADGTTRNFTVRYTPILADELAAKYPGLQTFTAVAVDNPNITAKLDYTEYGFHAIVFDGTNISLVDPAGSWQDNYYTVHYKKDETREPGKLMHCGVLTETASARRGMDVTARTAFRTTNGTTLKTYRLALACDNQYAAAVTGLSSPTIAQVLSKMVITMNRVNGVYERELAVTMVLVAQEDLLIFNVATGGVNGDDPFAAEDSNAGPCVSTNQFLCDSKIGNANYDLGHVFTTGAGGLSEIGVTCQPSYKAMSVTGQPNPYGDGFDIDYVTHEMGHEFGADHPFNDAKNGSCNPLTINEETAYEPGSGSTIMAYAGICPPDDLQLHSDPYFHAISLLEIQSYISGFGNACPVKTPTGNQAPVIPPFTASYYIPYLTPFELTAPAVTVPDSSVTYCWEQWNLGDEGQDLVHTHVYGPIFRSYAPVAGLTRVFPNITMVLADSLSNAGTEGAEGEKAPDVARSLTFKLTARNVNQGTGCFTVADDSILLQAINTGTGFSVTSQKVSGDVYPGNTFLNVTWNIAHTNAAPISAKSVDIYMSGDNGYTWPYYVGNFPNNGSASIILPNPDTTITAARIKVKGAGNVFFNVGRGSISVYHNDSSINAITVFPSPVRNTLHVYSGNKGLLRFEIYNVAGQRMTSGEVDGELDIPVNYWARGVYFFRFTDPENKRTVKKFVVE